MMRSLLQHEYAHDKWMTSPMSRGNNITHSNRCSKPLLPPPSPNHFLQSKNHLGYPSESPSNTKHMDLSSPLLISQNKKQLMRQQLREQRISEANYLHSDNAGNIDSAVDFQSEIQQQPIRVNTFPFNDHNNQYTNKEIEFDSHSNEYAYKPKPTLNSNENHFALEVPVPNIPEIIFHTNNRSSPMADRYRMSKKYDEWNQIQSTQKRIANDFYHEQKEIERSKKDNLRKILCKQMEMNTAKKSMRIEEKRRDYDRIQQIMQKEKEYEQQRKHNKYKQQQIIRQSLDKYHNMRQQITHYKKQKEYANDKQFLYALEKKERQEINREVQKLTSEKKMWEVLKNENTEKNKLREIQHEHKKHTDIQHMKEYSEMLEMEEKKRKMFFNKIQKRMSNQEKDLGIKERLEAQKQKILYDEERMLYHQKARDRKFDEKEKFEFIKKQNIEKEHKNFLIKQMQEKQRVKELEIELMKSERFEIERYLKEEEERKYKQKNDKRLKDFEYSKDLLQQRRIRNDRKIMNEYGMTDAEKAYHVSYISPSNNHFGSNQRFTIGAFPKGSISARDRRYLN